MQWTTRFEKYYLLLSSNGKLYYGVDRDPLKDVMDNVDAGKFYVVLPTLLLCFTGPVHLGPFPTLHFTVFQMFGVMYTLDIFNYNLQK